jgi:hypothetical protein
MNKLKVALVALKQCVEYEPQSDLGRYQKELNDRQLREYIVRVGKEAAS